MCRRYLHNCAFFLLLQKLLMPPPPFPPLNFKLPALQNIKIQQYLKLTFKAIECHSARMIKSPPALTLVLVQHKSMSTDWNALEEKSQTSGNVNRAMQDFLFIIIFITGNIICFYKKTR